ncbi:hypothetical protein AG1IA_05956 [Rhizoctonia solani AG-1 IA]|uniref:Uncharacterized protein n=1 Tax=Thanatephorus cucumeris (strain AG1-IA) TaxID=983506 RepID=L8WTD1_THACA|nr:hypothetical protein AG1IA_05956 [Rhizoctonia solani AG-1 IA]
MPRHSLGPLRSAVSGMRLLPTSGPGRSSAIRPAMVVPSPVLVWVLCRGMMNL